MTPDVDIELFKQLTDETAKTRLRKRLAELPERIQEIIKKRFAEALKTADQQIEAVIEREEARARQRGNAGWEVDLPVVELPPVENDRPLLLEDLLPNQT